MRGTELNYHFPSQEFRVLLLGTTETSFFSDFTLLRPKLNATGNLIIESQSKHRVKRNHKTNQQPHVTLVTLVEKTNT
jgi:hypothetical protein